MPLLTPWGLLSKPTEDTRVEDGETPPDIQSSVLRFYPQNFLFNPWPLTESPCVLVFPSHAGCARRDLPE